MISIVLPTYNGEIYIKQAIESIIQNLNGVIANFLLMCYSY